MGVFYPRGLVVFQNGTRQVALESLHAIIRGLLLSLMSGGGTISFFTGNGATVDRLPLGLNRSET